MIVRMAMPVVWYAIARPYGRKVKRMRKLKMERRKETEKSEAELLLDFPPSYSQPNVRQERH
jgi:hypothetical protein